MRSILICCVALLLGPLARISAVPPAYVPKPAIESKTIGNGKGKRIVIIASALELEPNSRFPEIAALFTGSADISELVVEAEVVKLQGRIHLPGGEIFVHCRSLEFVDSSNGIAGFSVEPLPYPERARAAVPGEQKGQDGKSGVNGGRIWLFAERWSGDFTKLRFNLRGGKGQDAGEGGAGRDGVEGQPGSATGAISAGIPGIGGAGGELELARHLAKDVDQHPELVDFRAGENGSPGKDQKGGAGHAGKPAVPAESGKRKGFLGFRFGPKRGGSPGSPAIPEVAPGPDAPAPLQSQVANAGKAQRLEEVPPDEDACSTIIRFLGQIQETHSQKASTEAARYLVRSNLWGFANGKYAEQNFTPEQQRFRKTLETFTRTP